jgi:hypothetical protein
MAVTTVSMWELSDTTSYKNYITFLVLMRKPRTNMKAALSVSVTREGKVKIKVKVKLPLYLTN